MKRSQAFTLAMTAPTVTALRYLRTAASLLERRSGACAGRPLNVVLL